MIAFFPLGMRVFFQYLHYYIIIIYYNRMKDATSLLSIWLIEEGLYPDLMKKMTHCPQTLGFVYVC